MIRRPPRSTRTDTLFPYTTLFRSAGGRRPPRLSALRRQPGVLLAGRPRLRVGTDAARPRPRHRRGGVEPAGLGTAHGEDPTRPTAARGKPPARTRRVRAPRSEKLRVGKECGSTSRSRWSPYH